MQSRIGFYQFLSGAGTAIVVTAISCLVLWQNSLFWESIAWQTAIFITLIALGSHYFEEDFQILNRLAFWLLLPLIFLLSYRVPVDVYFVYTIIWAAYAPIYVSWKWCWYWLIAINIGWYLIRLYSWEDSNPLAGTLLVATFHIFALLSARAAQESERANERTQKLNRELVATQHLLGEASREHERTRIARNLHDLLGHHLTALTINLQVAGRVSNGEAKEKIEQCHALSKLLLSDVREAVATLRDMPVVNLRELLQIAIKDIPRLNIDLDIKKDVHINDVETADVLLRLTQEAITNTLKHSEAHQAAIRVSEKDGNIILDYTDNGGGCEQLIPGHGLRGMRERLERIGGQLHLETSPSMSLHAIAPLSTQ